jgi:hypothetical protein
MHKDPLAELVVWVCTKVLQPASVFVLIALVGIAHVWLDNWATREADALAARVAATVSAAASADAEPAQRRRRSSRIAAQSRMAYR